MAVSDISAVEQLGRIWLPSLRAGQDRPTIGLGLEEVLGGEWS
jgi:hypothetical protein